MQTLRVDPRAVTFRQFRELIAGTPGADADRPHLNLPAPSKRCREVPILVGGASVAVFEWADTDEDCALDRSELRRLRRDWGGDEADEDGLPARVTFPHFQDGLFASLQR
eukprot:gene40894-53617_t